MQYSGVERRTTSMIFVADKPCLKRVSRGQKSVLQPVSSHKRRALVGPPLNCLCSLSTCPQQSASFHHLCSFRFACSCFCGQKFPRHASWCLSKNRIRLSPWWTYGRTTMTGFATTCHTVVCTLDSTCQWNVSVQTRRIFFTCSCLLQYAVNQQFLVFCSHGLALICLAKIAIMARMRNYHICERVVVHKWSFAPSLSFRVGADNATRKLRSSRL